VTAFVSVSSKPDHVGPILPRSLCPTCDSRPTLSHTRTERGTVNVVTLWCPDRHMWEVRWSDAA
jgi:hypothetical protein